MSSTMKLSLLSLVSVAAAVPHYGAHSKFHAPHGSVKPYPTGGWPVDYNSTAVPYPTGTGYYPGGSTTTLDVTSTSTSTLYSTVTVKPSSAPADVGKDSAPSGEGQCGGTVTVTAKEKVTITVTPGAEAPSTPAPEAPASSVESKSGNGYGAAPPAPSAPAAEYPAETPKVPATPSKTEAYAAPSYAEKPVQSSAAASSAAAPKPTGGNSYTGGKRGLAYNDAKLCSSLGSGYGFAYNWAQTESNDIGTNFIPLIGSPAKGTSEEWLSNVDKAAKKGSTAVMGFNECDHAEQCNLSPEAACAGWKEYMNPIKASHPDLTIIGPSVTNSGNAGMGLEWLSKFHDVCSDAAVDATNIHFYDIYEEATIDRFKAQVEKAVKLYGKKVWITEFGLNPGSATEEQAAKFLKEAMNYCDSSADVQGYAYFMVGSGENQLKAGSPVAAVYASTA